MGERVRDNKVVRDIKWSYSDVSCRAVSCEDMVKVVAGSVSRRGRTRVRPQRKKVRAVGHMTNDGRDIFREV